MLFIPNQLKADDRPSPARAKRGTGSYAALFVLSLMLHAAPLLAIWHAPQPRIGVGVSALSVEITFGATEAAGLASSPGEQEAISPRTAPDAPMPKLAAVLEPEPQETPAEQVQQLAMHGETTASTHPQQPRAAAVTSADSASGIGRGRSDSSTIYNGLIAAQVARFRQFPAGVRGAAVAGVVTVSFSIDDSGYVTSRQLLASSGNVAIDREALEMVRRASPFPPPPEDQPRNFIIPIRISAVTIGR